MPIVFDQIESEIAPERGAGTAEPAAPSAAREGSVVVELVMRELEIERERARRLIAD